MDKKKVMMLGAVAVVGFVGYKYLKTKGDKADAGINEAGVAVIGLTTSSRLNNVIAWKKENLASSPRDQSEFSDRVTELMKTGNYTIAEANEAIQAAYSKLNS